MGEVDPAFIQALEHRPKPSTTSGAKNIPLIDLSPLSFPPDADADADALARLSAEIGHACQNWGFFQVINHGVRSECREKIEFSSRKFFALPKEEKMKVSRDEVNPFGYCDAERTKNIRDWKEVFDFIVHSPMIMPASHEPDDMELKELTNKWPDDLPELREACEEHAAEMEKLAFKLLELIALSLGLPKNRLDGFFEEQTSRVRLNYYPPCPVPHLALGVGRHKDTGSLTILAQDDVGGLEVKRKTDGEWVLVNPTPDVYIVNVGDIIQAGVILGPSFIGSNRSFSDNLFPLSSFNVVDVFAFFGVMLFLFIIGVKTDLSLIRKSGKKAVTIGLGAFFLPLLLNFVIGQLLTHSIPMEPRLHRSISWIASFQGLTSFHVVVILLADLKLMNSELGRLAISSSMISGTCSWFWTVISFAGKHGIQVKRRSFLLMLLSLVLLVLFAICIFRPLILWMIRRTTNTKSVKESHVCTIFILVLGSAIYTEYIGQHFLFGPMILGIAIPDGPPLGTALLNKLEFFISSIILPIFFVVSAARIEFSAISFRNFAIIEFLAVFAVIWKVAGVMLPSIYWKMPMNEALYLGLILSNQGITEVLTLERAKAMNIIDAQSYSVMVVTILLFTAILAPIVKFSYKPSKRYIVGGRMTIQHANPHEELRILACQHYQEQTPFIINLFETSYPNPQAPICFYVIHLLDLAGRSAPALVAHQPIMRSSSFSNYSEHIINALRFFEHGKRGYVTVFPYTSISPYASMHNDVCSLAAEKNVSLLVILFHKHPSIHVSEEEANAVRTVNHNILQESPCSVGILVDCETMNLSASSLLQTGVYRIGVFFLGGPDDREALAYALRMAKHPNICLTLIQIMDDRMEIAYSSDMRQDLDIINEYRDGLETNKQCFYQEETSKDSLGVISIIRNLGSCFDLILVGRRHDEDSPLLAGLNEWNEFPELGCVADTLVSDSGCKATVLVVQQAVSYEDNLTDLNLVGHEDNRVWPAPTTTQAV